MINIVNIRVNSTESSKGHFHKINNWQLKNSGKQMYHGITIISHENNYISWKQTITSQENSYISGKQIITSQENNDISG